MKPYEIIGKFELLKHEVQKTLYEWLFTTLPNLERPQEWNKYVVNLLTPMQKGIIKELNYSKLQDLDFAMLLSVVLGNWKHLRNTKGFTRENEHQFKQMRFSRNRWSHLPTRDIEQFSPTGIDNNYVEADLANMKILIRRLKADHPVLQKIQDFVEDFHRDATPVPDPIPPHDETPRQTSPNNERENQIKIAYVMSRFDYNIINDIRGVMQNQKKTFAYLSAIMNVNINTLKNNRDSFDPYVKQENSNRRGWWQKELTPEFKAIKEKYDDKEYDVIKKEIEKLIL